jgi:predicted nucleic acid-binding Zn ribbon protein
VKVPDGSDFDRLGDLLATAGEGVCETQSEGTPGHADRDRPDRSVRRSGARLPSTERRTAATANGAAADHATDEVGDLSRRLAEVWEDAVGAEIAANAHPVYLRSGRLVVTTSSSAWAQTLQGMSEMVAVKVNEKLGAEAVGRVVFRHAGWEDFPTAAAEAARPGMAPGTPAAHLRVYTAGPTSGNSTAVAAGPAIPAAGAVGSPAGLSGSRLEDDLTLLSDDQRRALADLEALPLSVALKDTIREAMVAGFVRARQDFSR